MLSSRAVALRAGARCGLPRPLAGRVAAMRLATSRAIAGAHLPRVGGVAGSPLAVRHSRHLNSLAATPRSNEHVMRRMIMETLANIGTKQEVQQYLALFTSVESQRFAVIKVGGAILSEHLDELCRSLASLYKVGLYPVVVHGAGPQLNSLLEEAGVVPSFEEGIRITDAKTLRVATKLFRQENLKLVNKLEQCGVHALPLQDGIFEAEYLDRDKWGFVGKVTHVNKEAIEMAINNDFLPVLTSMAATEGGQILNVNADVAAAALARAVEPLKVVYLSEKGGLFDANNAKMSTIDLHDQYDHLMSQEWIKYGTRLKIKEIKELLDTLPKTDSVAIVHPKDLQKELFTESGAGTLIRRGNKLLTAASIADFKDMDRLRAALLRDREGAEGAGARATVDTYIDFLSTNPFKAYFDENMDTLAIVLLPSHGQPWATLATLTIARSNWMANFTLANKIFATLKQEHGNLVWTAEHNDGNLDLFYKISDGNVKIRGDIMFWCGVDNNETWYSLYDDFTSNASTTLKNSNLQARLYHRSGSRASPAIAATAAAAATTASPAIGAATSTTTASSPGNLTSDHRPTVPPAAAGPAASFARPAQTREYVATTNPNPPYGKKNASKTQPARIALIGARGYTGQELIRLLDSHPHMDLCHVSSRELAGKKLEGYHKREVVYENLSAEDVRDMEKKGAVDCWVMALPNGVCRPFVEAVYEGRQLSTNSDQHKSVILDLSADYRFDHEWTYGLPELVARARIAEATQIANPGCYATAAQLGIAPLLEHVAAGVEGGAMPHIFGVSGYSGAGTKPSPKNDAAMLADNLMPYSLTGHVHEREIGAQLGMPVAFFPHVASWFRGIHHTISIPLRHTMTSRDIRQLYQDRYAGEKLVKVVGEAPLVKNISGKHGVEIGGFETDKTGRRVVVCATIDNLNKGAATQGLQNMNLALGFAEYEGIPTM